MESLMTSPQRGLGWIRSHAFLAEWSFVLQDGDTGLFCSKDDLPYYVEILRSELNGTCIQKPLKYTLEGIKKIARMDGDGRLQRSVDLSNAF